MDSTPYRARPEGTRPLGQLSHKRNRAVFRTHKGQGEYLQSIFDDPLTREADYDPFPYPPPPDGAPFLYTVGGDVALQLRHYAGPMDWASPIAELHFEDEGKTTLLRVEFCPIGHPWGPPPAPYDDKGYSIYAGTRAHRLQLLINRFIGRRMYRQQMLALLDRHCAIGQSVESSAAPHPDASDTAP